MIKVAFVTKHMAIGGTEKALLALLANFNSENIKVDLYLENMEGKLMDEIPQWINVIQIPKFRDFTIKHILKNPCRFAKALVNRAFMNNREPYYLQCKRACLAMPLISHKYDYAISYHAPDSVPFFYVINNVIADKKIMWLHFDVEKTNAINSTSKIYFEKYDKIYAVSKQVKEVFLFHYPHLAQKTDIFYNILDKKAILEKAKLGPSYEDDFEGKRILSIGRLEYLKGYDLLIPVIKKLKDEEYNVRLYICGDGSKREEIEMLIEDYCLNKDVILLGAQENPYRYLKECALYVQPSRTEGFCTTTNEARLFNKPIVVTNVCGMNEQFVDGVTGKIVECNSNALFCGIKELLDNPLLCERYVENLSKIRFDENIHVERLFE